MKLIKVISLVSVLLLGSCAQTTEIVENNLIVIDDLVILGQPNNISVFETELALEPLKQEIIDELIKYGYQVNAVEISIGTDYLAIAEAVSSGAAHVGMVSASTYISVKNDGVEPLLATAKETLNVDSTDILSLNSSTPAEWVEGSYAAYVDAILVSGPSSQGEYLKAKILNNEDLSFDDVNKATWCVRSPNLFSGYILPTMWLNENFGKTILDLNNVLIASTQSDIFAYLAQGACDIGASIMENRIDLSSAWQNEFNREKTIWEETGIIAVTGKVPYNLITVSTETEFMTSDFKLALKETLQSIIQTDTGKEAFSTYDITYLEDVDLEYLSYVEESMNFVKSLN